MAKFMELKTEYFINLDI